MRRTTARLILAAIALAFVACTSPTAPNQPNRDDTVTVGPH
ncbi:MAG TPA: hypothetical protein VIC24_13270 [Gemmatimonadaceae bacterium]|jgi:hypothetical protein